MTNFAFHDVQGRLDLDVDPKGQVLGVQRFQEIPDSFVKDLRDLETTRSRFTRRPDSIKVASIPALFVAKWMNEGFNVYQEPLSEIRKKLVKEGLEAFLVKE